MTHQSESEPPIEEVDEATLRQYYNSIGEFELRIQRGDLLVKVMPGSEREAPALLGEPVGTKSRMVLMFDRASNQLLVKAHEYRRPDGSLGGSGKRDPKWIRRQDGTIMKQRRRRAPTQ